MPFGVNSPVRSFAHLDVTPIVMKQGIGEKLIDVDGNAYIDFCQSWGALIHGHAHPNIVRAVKRRVAMGTTFGTATEEELLLAQKIKEHIPFIELMRFVSSGTEATMTALRLARGFTNKEIIVKFSGNYHGHSDSLLVKAGSGVALLSESSSLGILKNTVEKTVCLPYNCLDFLQDFFKKNGDQIAAVIVEPIAANMGVVPAEQEFIQQLRSFCTKYHALLIFDEVVTGYRVQLGSVSSLFGVVPDLVCLGKVIGGGFPAALVGGKKEIMECLAPLGQVYQAGTLSGNPVAMQAGLEALRLCEKEGFYSFMQKKVAFLLDPICELIEKKALPCCVQRVGSFFTIFFGVKQVRNFQDAMQCDQLQFRNFFLYLLERGVYLSPAPFEAHFISSVHSMDTLAETRNLICEFISQI